VRDSRRFILGGAQLEPDSGQRRLAAKPHPCVNHPLVHGSDRLPSGHRPIGWVRQHPLRLVERRDAGRIAGIQPLDNQPRHILRLHRPASPLMSDLPK
jgi:hypothetical protein